MSCRRVLQTLALVLIAAAGLQEHPSAQGPIAAAREAFRKAQEDARRRQQGQPPPAQPAPQTGQPAQAPQVLHPNPIAGPDGNPETTAKIAASLAYLDVAGIKLGMPLTNTVALLKTINPKFQNTPVTEIMWPLDRSNTAAQPPPDAPKSVINVTAETYDTKGNVESFRVDFAKHPNAPIVMGIHRKLGWAPGTGPGIDNLVNDLRKKYGPESLITKQTTNNAQREITLRWYYDPSGLKLQGNLAQQPGANCNVSLAGPAPGLCGTLVVLDAEVSAPGSGVVSTLLVDVESHPLTDSARQATDAYLKAVDEERAKRQRNDAAGRATPKL
jgi:hypothetical protein